MVRSSAAVRIPSPRTLHRFIAAIAFVLVTTCGPAGAATLTWNTGSGTWDTTTANWQSSSGAVAWPSSGTDNDGVFSGTAATVTLSGGVLANELLFGTGGYAVQGSGTLTLNGVSPTVTVSAGTAMLGNATASVLTGTGGIRKSGSGTLLLSPSTAATLTGGVAVNGGVLAVSPGNLSTPTNLLPSSNSLTLAGGTFSLIEKPGVLASQTFSGLSVGQGLAATSMTRTTGTVQLDLGIVSQQAPRGIISLQNSNTTTALVRVSNGPSAYARGADGTVYFVDSESSTVRRVRGGLVSTIAGGTSGLFAFGDVDGIGEQVRLQHPLGIASTDAALYIADTYNHRIKRVDPATGEVLDAAPIADEGAEAKAA